jgi:PAS domain S-box-containing protein
MINDSEARAHILMGSMRDTCQIIDFNWKYLYANDVVAKQCRHTRDGLLKLTLMEAYPGIETTEIFTRLSESMAKRIPNQLEQEYILPNGTTGCFRLHIVPVKEGILVYTVESTVTKKLESSFDLYRERLEEVIAERTAKLVQVNTKLQQTVKEYKKASGALHLRATILEKVTEAILLIDLYGKFIYVNDAACKMYGFPKEELIKINLQQLVVEQEIPTLREKLKLLLRHGEMHTEMTHMRKDRSCMPVRLYSSIIELPAGRCIISAVRDISREKQIENTLRRCEVQLTLD